MTEPARRMRRGLSSREGLQALCEHLVNRGLTGTLVEIGVYLGESTEIFARYMNSVYAVDPWRTGYDPKDVASRENGADIMKQYIDRVHPLTNVRTLHMSGMEASRMFQDASLDVVYIDANHAYYAVLEDIRTWYPKVKIGGVISGHDYQMAGVRQAVNEMLPGREITTFQDNSWASNC